MSTSTRTRRIGRSLPEYRCPVETPNSSTSERHPQSGAIRTTPIAIADVCAAALDVDDAYVYYDARDPNAPGGLYRCLRAGGTPEPMSNSLNAGGYYPSVQVYKDSVYTAIDSGDGSSDGTGGWTGSIV